MDETRLETSMRLFLVSSALWTITCFKSSHDSGVGHCIHRPTIRPIHAVSPDSSSGHLPPLASFVCLFDKIYTLLLLYFVSD